MSNNTMFSLIPDEILLIIFRYLDFKTLLKLSLVSRKCYTLSNFDDLWKIPCANFWLITELPKEDDRWKSCFRRFFIEFGRYTECYAEIKSLWRRIDQITAERAPLVNDSLNLESPLTEKELDDIERNIGHKLPNDFRCSYRICDGQVITRPYGLFGGYDLDDMGDFLLSLEGCESQIFEELKTCIRNILPSDSDLFPFAGRKNAVGRFLVLNHCLLGLFLTRDANSNPPNGSVVSLDFSKELTSNWGCFIYAKSFKSFLQTFAEQLVDYPVHNNRILKFSLNSIGETGPFQVETRTAFVREHSCVSGGSPYAVARHKYVYHYYITMKMDPKASVVDSCQLETRHWVITDGNGQVDRVDGPGVVGEYPLMRPGASHFWISGTSFKTPVGEMTGHFTMKNLKSGLPVQINCPIYVMKAPESIRF